MDKRKGPEDYEDLVNALADLFDEVGPETPEEVDMILVEAGYDPDEVAEHMNAIARQAMLNSPLSWRKRAQKELQEERARLEGLGGPPVKGRLEIVAAIQELIRRMGGEHHELVRAHFRNLEQATDDDLASLLRELEYLADRQQDGPSDSKE
jgi:hypothetical protein